MRVERWRGSEKVRGSRKETDGEEQRERGSEMENKGKKRRLEEVDCRSEKGRNVKKKGGKMRWRMEWVRDERIQKRKREWKERQRS